MLSNRADKFAFEELRGPESRSNLLRKALEKYKTAGDWSEELDKCMMQLNDFMEACDKLNNEQTAHVNEDFKAFWFFFRTHVLNDYWARGKKVNVGAGTPLEQYNRFSKLCNNYHVVNKEYTDRWETCEANPLRVATVPQPGAQQEAQSDAQAGAQEGAQV